MILLKIQLYYVSTHDLTKRSTESIGLIATQQVFQLTTSRRGRHSPLFPNAVQLMFQLTTSRRGRLAASMILPNTVLFQLTTSRRGRPVVAAICDTAVSFQLTTSRRGRPQESNVLYTQRCFNSRPHEEVDSNFYAKSFPFKITFCAHCI